MRRYGALYRSGKPREARALQFCSVGRIGREKAQETQKGRGL